MVSWCCKSQADGETAAGPRMRQRISLTQIDDPLAEQREGQTSADNREICYQISDGHKSGS